VVRNLRRTRCWPPLAAGHLIAQLAAGISRDDVVAGLVEHAELVVGV
jgi:hypothetical protein